MKKLVAMGILKDGKVQKLAFDRNYLNALNERGIVILNALRKAPKSGQDFEAVPRMYRGKSTLPGYQS